MPGTNPAQPLAVVVHTIDAYSLLFKGFGYFFNRYWDMSAPCRYYFLTEELDVNISPFTIIKTGKGEWSDRLRRGLEQIPEDRILYMQEDFWLSAPVSGEFLRQALAYMNEKGSPLLKLHRCDRYVTQPADDFIEGFRMSRLNNQASRYQMSHQISIWDKSLLLSQLPQGEHPWRNERKGTERMKQLNLPILQADYFRNNNDAAHNDNLPDARPSAYATVSNKFLFNVFTPPFIEAMKASGDPEMEEYGQLIEKCYHDSSRHDGKPPVRKPWYKKLFK